MDYARAADSDRRYVQGAARLPMGWRVLPIRIRLRRADPEAAVKLAAMDLEVFGWALSSCTAT